MEIQVMTQTEKGINLNLHSNSELQGLIKKEVRRAVKKALFKVDDKEVTHSGPTYSGGKGRRSKKASKKGSKK